MSFLDGWHATGTHTTAPTAPHCGAAPALRTNCVTTIVTTTSAHRFSHHRRIRARVLPPAPWRVRDRVWWRDGGPVLLPLISHHPPHSPFSPRSLPLPAPSRPNPTILPRTAHTARAGRQFLRSQGGNKTTGTQHGSTQWHGWRRGWGRVARAVAQHRARQPGEAPGLRAASPGGTSSLPTLLLSPCRRAPAGGG